MGSQPFPGRDWEVEIRGFEFDARNLDHMAKHGADENVVWDVWSGEPRCFPNRPAPNRSGTHLMIGPDANGRVWTIAMVLIDPELALWRPITAYPSSTKERRAWQDAT